MEVSATQRLDRDQHPIGVQDLVLGLKECENSHTLTTATTGSKTSQKEVNNQTDSQNQCSVPPPPPPPPQRFLLCQLLVLDEVKGKTQTQQQKLS